MNMKSLEISLPFLFLLMVLCILLFGNVAKSTGGYVSDTTAPKSCLHRELHQGLSDSPAEAKDSANYREVCIDAISNHVRMEFEAALQYLLMGAYFDQDNVNLKGFSKIFFDHADEERMHGQKFIKYLRMRGNNMPGSNFVRELLPILAKDYWENGEEALRDALTMEKEVSGSIKNLVDVCSDDTVKDYQAADWLTNTWLTEQLDEQRKLAGMINTLSLFRRDHNELADWMFSNQLLL